MARPYRKLIEHGRGNRADQVCGEIPARMALRATAGEVERERRSKDPVGTGKWHERRRVIRGVMETACVDAVPAVELEVDSEEILATGGISGKRLGKVVVLRIDAKSIDVRFRIEAQNFLHLGEDGLHRRRKLRRVNLIVCDSGPGNHNRLGGIAAISRLRKVPLPLQRSWCIELCGATDGHQLPEEFLTPENEEFVLHDRTADLVSDVVVAIEFGLIRVV